MFALSILVGHAQAEWALVIAVHLLLLRLEVYVQRFGQMLAHAHVEGDVIVGLPFHAHIIGFPQPPPGQVAYLFPMTTMYAYTGVCHRAAALLVYMAWAQLMAKLTQNIWGSLRTLDNF